MQCLVVWCAVFGSGAKLCSTDTFTPACRLAEVHKKGYSDKQDGGMRGGEEGKEGKEG